MMKDRRTVRLISALLCYTVVIAGVFYCVGYQAAADHVEAPPSVLVAPTFYAVISDIEGHYFTVAGMEINDINFRGMYCFSVTEKTKIEWRASDIPVEELEVGDKIAVTFSGEILESNPATLRQVEAIRLLDDEK